MRLVADISAFQTHNSDWSAWQPIDLAAFAGAVDGAWVRWTDWSGYVRWGPDPGHGTVIDTLRDWGKPVGSYLYPRPNLSDPQTQVARWFSETPALSFAPMLDPEANGGLSGPDFSRWVDVALAEMAQRWQRVPWLYAAKSTVDEFGWTRPSTPHRLILAEYHWGYDPFWWGDRADWERRAYSKYGGPEIPTGWPYLAGQPDAWQFTSSGEVPGMAGLIDCSWMSEHAFQASAGGLASTPADDGFGPGDRAVVDAAARKMDMIATGFGVS